MAGNRYTLIVAFVAAAALILITAPKPVAAYQYRGGRNGE